MTLPRSHQRALSFIQRYIRENDAPPSLGDMSYGLRCSRQRAHELVLGLDRAGQITRTPGKPLSIRLVEPMQNCSDDALLHQIDTALREAQRRGIVEPGPMIGVSLTASFPCQPLTDLELSDGASLDHILARIDRGDQYGQG